MSNIDCMDESITTEEPITIAGDASESSHQFNDNINNSESNFGSSDEYESTNYTSDDEETNKFQLDEELMANREKRDTGNIIGAIASKHKWTLSSVSDLAVALKEKFHINIPIDARTIMFTPRDKLSSEEFIHLGLECGLRGKLARGVNMSVSTILIQVNIDGIPIYTNSQIAFWPILVRAINICDTKPFIVSVFCGRSKPASLQGFLGDFIREFNDLHSNIRRLSVCH